MLKLHFLRAREPQLARRRWLALAAASVAMLSRLDAQAAPRVIKVHARRFTFTPDHIALAPHESVVFEVTSQDTTMGFSIPQFGVRADVPPGAVVRVAATAGDAGNVPFLCDIFCGSGHESMNGVIVVG
ncbi:cytochrome c oxidase subunit 2 [Paraburkholderia bannensis]|uniref:Cytochrome c oxidase subunit 2 n=1 Tax=Paraburkholderia bannensis TaxID=765414 RepID=A0A7W9WUT4_9BURK|nr:MULTISPECIES: cupredoxin domain-containing protein [Paraburkholderia]MBB3259665.1 cytochrome c oxidase subunit 2 [Paraburkholderia sp. WP4_3_2]MBB6104681.1 cytochrome c oxidase subunit 2 [Paraburkholderia bannensis]